MNIDSTIATKQSLALTRGPNSGSPGPECERNLCAYSDTLTASATLGTTERLRFGVLHAGGRIEPHLSWITSQHTATIAGSIVLTPTDGSATTTITGVTITRDAATPGASFGTGQDYPVVNKPCFVDFVPTAATTFAGNVAVRARLVFTLNT
ncbi:MAG: hypothetical protein JWO82_1475 [Akkermansiaceae bacterium]|nr:hypothetical protein [Akkermansiaceae bacterium]